MYSIVLRAHLNTGHGERDKMLKEVNKKYANVTRNVLNLFKEMCEECQLKKRKNASKGLVVKLLLIKDFNSRGQVDLVDMQSMRDGDFKFILHYQDHLTKFAVLRPLTSKLAAEVGFQLLDIFLLFGAPHILQSDNGREFTAHGLLCSLESEEDLVKHLNRAEEEGNDLRAPGHLDQPDTQDDGLEIEICTVCEKSCFVKVKCSMCSKANADLVVCHLCFNEEVISEERRNASESMRRQANRMRNLSERILTEVEVGKNILIPIPMVDSGKGDPRNLLAVVLSREEHGYKLGTKSGVLCGLYTRNQFELSDNNFLAKDTVQL
jgi:hypothetical protein